MNYDFSTIDEFDKHIEDSISGYKCIHQIIKHISSFFINDGTTIIDIGCTTGHFINEIANKYNVDCLGYDINNSHFGDYNNLICKDVTSDNFKLKKTTLIYSIFTLQFLTIEDRAKLLSVIYNSLYKGGAVIVCEKEHSVDSFSENIFQFTNYDKKRYNFTDSQILEKERSLRGKMLCLTENENKKMFNSVGFKKVYIFFQSLNFKGYLLVK